MCMADDGRVVWKRQCVMRCAELERGEMDRGVAQYYCLPRRVQRLIVYFF